MRVATIGHPYSDALGDLLVDYGVSWPHETQRFQTLRQLATYIRDHRPPPASRFDPLPVAVRNDLTTPFTEANPNYRPG